MNGQLRLRLERPYAYGVVLCARTTAAFATEVQLIRRGHAQQATAPRRAAVFRFTP